jgi:hypothetical protein
MSWLRVRPTLNGRTPHTMRDASRDPWDWGTRYRAPWHRRAADWLGILGVLTLFAGLVGILLAWRG